RRELGRLVVQVVVQVHDVRAPGEVERLVGTLGEDDIVVELTPPLEVDEPDVVLGVQLQRAYEADRSACQATEREVDDAQRAHRRPASLRRGQRVQTGLHSCTGRTSASRERGE